MNKKLLVTGLLVMMFLSISAFAAGTPPSIASVAEVYVDDAERAHYNVMEASSAVATASESAIVNGREAVHDYQTSIAAASDASVNSNAPERDAYDAARNLAQIWANLARIRESMIMSEHKAAIAEAAAARAGAVVAEDAAVNAENLAANTETLAKKVKFSVGPNDKNLLQKAAEKARRLANEANTSANNAQEVALKIMYQITQVNAAALRSDDAISKIKPYAGPISR